MREEVLRMERVACRAQGVLQLEDFNLHIFAGEIMGLLPVSGHGLTALIELLRRNTPLQEGYIYYREERLNSWHTPRPQYNRIGVIQSKGSLVDGLTVADNIFVLRPGFRTWLIRPAVLRRQLQPFLDELGAGVSADDYVEHLTAFQRCVVELAKAIMAGNHLVILRDVSTFISESELFRLHAILRRYAAQGVAFLYIGYHFEELRQICDRTAMLRNGRITKILRQEENPDLYDSRLWVQAALREAPRAPGPPVFRCDHLSGGAVEDLSFAASSGECVVLQDLNSLIFGDLSALLMGELPLGGGALWLDGTPFAPAPTRRLALVLEQPGDSMLFPTLSYLDNLCFTIDHRLPELWRSSRVRAGLRKACGGELGADLFDRRPEKLTKAQKYDLVYHRLLLQNPSVVFCVQPFRGADLDLRMHIRGLLEQLMDRGIAVVILAVNLADALSLATRLIRIRRGGPAEVYERAEFGKIPFSAPWRDLWKRPLS